MISVIIPVYHNEEALLTNLKYLRDQEAIKEIIIVFDGYKPQGVFQDSLFGYMTGSKFISNYPDEEWGNARARNIGAINSSLDWLLFLDVDHTFKQPIPQVELHALRKKAVNKFKRIYQGETKWPSGSILIHRETFFGIGGYNEAFCGNYGYEDLELIDRVKKSHNTEIQIDVLPNGGVSLERDTSVNKVLYDQIKRGI